MGNTRKRKLYFHIGTPKTGTTAIQIFCNRYKEKIDEFGIYYPTPNNGCYRTDLQLSQDGNVGGFARSGKTIEELATDIANLLSTEKDTLVSSESFWLFYNNNIGRIASELKKRKPDIDINIIVYLRNQADYFESVYREIIESYWMTINPEDVYTEMMTGCKGNADDSLVKMIISSCDYWKCLSSIRTDAPDCNLIIKNYDDMVLENKNLLEQFFSIMNIDISDLDCNYAELVANPSISAELLEAKRVLNVWNNGSANDFQSVFMDGYRAILGGDSKKRKDVSLFSEQQRLSIWNKYRDGNRKISEKFFCRMGDLFNPPAEKKMEKFEIKTYIDEAIRLIGGAIIMQEKQFIKRELILKSRMFFLINSLNQTAGDMCLKNDLRIAGWGAGYCLENNLEFAKEVLNIEVVCDSNKDKWGKRSNGLTIISPEQLKDYHPDCIVIFIYDLTMAKEVERLCRDCKDSKFVHINSLMEFLLNCH